MRKIKIGILTFHRSINYGAFLQCFSLVSKINNVFGDSVNAEVIDYCPEFEIEKYKADVKTYIFGSSQNKSSIKMAIKNTVKLVLSPSIISQKRMMQAAFEKSYDKLPKSELMWITDDYNAFLSNIKDEYDIIIVGSDAVWETLVFSFPNAYFLNDCVNAIQISYAACTGRMDLSMYSKEQITFLSKRWSSFKYLGVRDDATANLIRSINSNLVPQHNCDPTITLDFEQHRNLFDKSKCKEILRKHGIDPKKPIIGLMGGNALGKLIRELFGNKYQVVALYYPNMHADVYLPELTPFEWAVMFSMFFITFTRFFHGTIFSLKNGVQTISVDDWKLNDKEQKSKLHDLLDRLKLNDYLYSVDYIYTPEGKEKVRQAVESALRTSQSERIMKALDAEKRCFDSFSSALGSIILDLETRVDNGSAGD